MNQRRIKFFEALQVPGAKVGDVAGLAEYLLQNALASHHAFADSDGCELVQLLYPILTSWQGAGQGKRELVISQGQWEKLVDLARPKGPLQWELSHITSLSMGALYAAELVQEKTEKSAENS